jgi:metal-responsive CopG/Arc/MetJ family transcriptional regulator
VVRARIPESLKQEFETAAARGWSLSHAIRQLMRQYVAQEKERDRRRTETLEPLADVEAGGWAVLLGRFKKIGGKNEQPI